jgi:hypothetical protein
VEAVVDQALGDVLDADPGLLLQDARVEDALMRDAAVAARVEHGIVGLQLFGDVVGRQDRDLGGVLQPDAPIMRIYIQVIGRIEALPSGAAATAWLLPAVDMARQDRGEMRLDADRADARPAAAMRDAEGLVQVHVADIGAEIAGARESPTMALRLAPSR